jgi:hypothetical protein
VEEKLLAGDDNQRQRRAEVIVKTATTWSVPVIGSNVSGRLQTE